MSSGLSDRPDDGDYEDQEPCSWCGGDGLCSAGADPLDNCPENPHRCHACGGSGKAKDQVIW